MNDLTDRFESQRERLRGIAYRMLGSRTEADDAVQETWLRLVRVDADRIENLEAWLTTVVSRVCLDALRSRTSRREDLVGEPDPDAGRESGAGDPEEEVLMAEAVGRAVLVVMDRLSPAERVAFVLHDMFGVPFDEIAPVVDRSPVATKKLASRARQRLRGTSVIDADELTRHRRVIEAFLEAARAGDVAGVVAVLAPDVVRRAEHAALAAGRPTEVRGARTVADEIVVFGRSSRFAEPVLLDGGVGIVVAPGGRLQLALRFTIEHGRIAEYELIADPGRLRALDLAVLDG